MSYSSLQAHSICALKLLRLYWESSMALLYPGDLAFLKMAGERKTVSQQKTHLPLSIHTQPHIQYTSSHLSTHINTHTHTHTHTHTQMCACTHIHLPLAAREMNNHNGNASRNAEESSHKISNPQKVVPPSQPSDLRQDQVLSGAKGSHTVVWWNCQGSHKSPWALTYAT